jgi:hypothetical protein
MRGPAIPTARLADAICAAIESDKDPRTLAAWAQCAESSKTSLVGLCQMLNVRPKDVLSLARMIRAVKLARDGTALVDFLEVSDPRTLKKLLLGAGLRSTAHRQGDVHCVTSQTFVSHTRLLDLLRQRGYPL